MEFRRREIGGVVWIAPAEAGEPELPSLGRRVVNFVKATAVNAAGYVRTGQWNRSPEEAAAVHEICRSGCTFYRKAQDECAHPQCGCSLKGKLRNKTQWRTTRCPLGKWDGVMTKGQIPNTKGS